jgi:chemotaxis protein MotB
VFASYEGSGLKLEERDGRLYVMTNPVNYKSGSYRLNRAERDAIKGLAESVKKNPNLKLLIEGHTDNAKVNPGSALQDNWQLSTMRSLAIVRELVKNGVNPNQVAAVGRGESMPKSANGDKAGKAVNRRSEVVVDVPLKGILDAAKKN